MCLFLRVNNSGRFESLLEQLESSDESSELDDSAYFVFFWNLAGRIASFLIELL